MLLFVATVYVLSLIITKDIAIICTLLIAFSIIRFMMRIAIYILFQLIKWFVIVGLLIAFLSVI